MYFYTFTPTTPLPAITAPVTIDGTTQPYWTPDQPLIDINGNSAGSSAPALQIDAKNVTVQGLSIYSFQDGAISISGSGSANDLVDGNWIGFDSNAENKSNGGEGLIINGEQRAPRSAGPRRRLAT